MEWKGWVACGGHWGWEGISGGAEQSETDLLLKEVYYSATCIGQQNLVCLKQTPNLFSKPAGNHQANDGAIAHVKCQHPFGISICITRIVEG